MDSGEKVDVVPSHPFKLATKLNRLARWCGQQARASGWDDNRVDRLKGDKQAVAQQASVDAALIASEAFELFEDLRNGHQMWDLWYEDENGKRVDFSEDDGGKLTKPCGPASEIADIIIRCLHISYRERINIGQVVVQKLMFNATRGHRHGGKMF